jgi:hypothetical protein
MKHWIIQAKLKGFRPLAINGGKIYGYIKGSIVRTDFELREIEWLCDLPLVKFKFKWLTRFRLVDRILRLSPTIGYIQNGQLFIVRRSDIFRLDINKKILVKEFTIPDGRRALSLSEILLETGEKNLVFGEYFDNPNRSKVNIWGRFSASNAWRILATIPAGEIEHIHTIKQIQDDVWILTGDFEKSAGIWKSNNQFLSIQPILRYSQQYRGAWITSLKGRVFYATDTQMEENNVYEMTNLDCDTPRVRICGALTGSSIYDAHAIDRHYFSTTVESGPPSGSILVDIFDMRRGPGIKSKTAHIMTLGTTGEVETIYSANKDFLPFRLAQFGTFTFPSGSHSSNTVVAYGIGLQGNDDICLVLRKD